MKLYQITYNDGEGYDDIESWLFASDDDIDCEDPDAAHDYAVALGIHYDECDPDERWRTTLDMEEVKKVSIIKNGKHIKKRRKVVL